MLNVLSHFLDLSFQASRFINLREQIKFLDNHKDQLFFYRMGIETELFSTETSNLLIELVIKQIGEQTNLNPYVLYVLWGRSLFVFNLTKRNGNIIFSVPTQIKLDPLIRPTILSAMQSQEFGKLLKLPKHSRENFGLLHALEADNYNQLITKYLSQIIPIESFLAQEFGFDPFFVKKAIQDFCLSLPEEYTLPKSPSKNKGSGKSQVIVHKMIDFDVHPYLFDIYALKHNAIFTSAIKMSTHERFIPLFKVNQELLRIHDFIVHHQIYRQLFTNFLIRAKLGLFEQPSSSLSAAADLEDTIYSGLVDLFYPNSHFQPDELRHWVEPFKIALANKENVQQEIINIMNRLSIGDMYQLVKTFDALECEAALKLHQGFDRATLSIFQGLVFQRQIDLLLNSFGISNEFHSNINRIILTTNLVPEGLIKIISILKLNGIEMDINSIKGMDINSPDLIIPTGLDIADVEIAWGILDACLRKQHRVYISCSKDLIMNYIPKLSPNSTLVLDGHGGGSEVRIGSHSGTYSVGKLMDLTLEFFKKDEKLNIDHIILQSCATGKLNSRISQATIYTKKCPEYSGKQKKLVIVNSPTSLEESTQPSLFLKSAQNSSLCLAESVIKAIFKSQRQYHTAFTFSPFAINPCYVLGMGNVGLSKPASSKSQIIKWGEDIENFGSIKSNTLFWTTKHRKLKNITGYHQQDFVYVHKMP